MTAVLKMVPNNYSFIPNEWRAYLSGGAAAVVNITITFPLNKTMFRQMVHGISVTEAVKQLYQEGAIRLYRGALPPLGQQAVSRSLMFGNYALFKRQISDWYPHLNPTTVLASAAFLAGCTEALLTPFERVQVLLQDSKQHSNYANTIDALRKIKEKFGYREFYRGMHAVALRGSAGSLLYFHMKEQVEFLLPASILEDEIGASLKWKWLTGFITGATVGPAVSTVVYPFKPIIAHMQLKAGGKFLSLIPVTVTLVKSRGIRGLYYGLPINCMRSSISWGTTTATYEFVHQYLSTIQD